MQVVTTPASVAALEAAFHAKRTPVPTIIAKDG